MTDDAGFGAVPPDEGEPVSAPPPGPEGDPEDGVEPIAPESDDEPFDDGGTEP